MGGLGSGMPNASIRYGRKRNKNFTMHYKQLDASILKWNLMKDLKEESVIIRELDIDCKVYPDRLTVAGEFQQEPYTYNIPLIKHPCNFGGYRYFMKCPKCAKQCRILYLGYDLFFLCRDCLNLAYLSQNLSIRHTFWKRQDRILKKIGTKDIFQKTKYMHSTTFHRLQEQYWAIEEDELEWMKNYLAKWELKHLAL